MSHENFDEIIENSQMNEESNYIGHLHFKNTRSNRIEKFEQRLDNYKLAQCDSFIVNELPIEIFVMIVEYLDLPDIINMASTSRFLYCFIMSNNVMRKIQDRIVHCEIPHLKKIYDWSFLTKDEYYNFNDSKIEPTTIFSDLVLIYSCDEFLNNCDAYSIYKSILASIDATKPILRILNKISDINFYGTILYGFNSMFFMKYTLEFNYLFGSVSKYGIDFFVSFIDVHGMMTFGIIIDDNQLDELKYFDSATEILDGFYYVNIDVTELIHKIAWARLFEFVVKLHCNQSELDAVKIDITDINDETTIDIFNRLNILSGIFYRILKRNNFENNSRFYNKSYKAREIYCIQDLYDYLDRKYDIERLNMHLNIRKKYNYILEEQNVNPSVKWDECFINE